MYVLCSTLDNHVRFAPLYIHSFRLYAPHKILEATMMNQTYRSYEEITSIPDRLRWLRHSKGLMQREAAQIAGVSRSVYIDIECGITRRLPGCLVLNLPKFYGVPASWMNTTDSFSMDKPNESGLTGRSGGGEESPFAATPAFPCPACAAGRTGRKRSVSSAGRCTLRGGHKISRWRNHATCEQFTVFLSSCCVHREFCGFPWYCQLRHRKWYNFLRGFDNMGIFGHGLIEFSRSFPQRAAFAESPVPPHQQS